jgi:pimeloyl-ACP methyl ester carboxylesterase
MKTIVYMLHGMGQGSDDGTAPESGKEWWHADLATLEDIANRFGIPIVPQSNMEAGTVSIVPLTYHDVFDQYRARVAAAATADENERGLLDGPLHEKLKSVPMGWTHWLDVLLLMLTDRLPVVVSSVLHQMVSAEAPYLAAGTPFRRVLVSHSLGTAVATQALRAWPHRSGGPQVQVLDTFFTLANVAPLVLQPTSAYERRMVPGDLAPITRVMVSSAHIYDPIPDLLFWRSFNPLGQPAPVGTPWKDARSTNYFVNTSVRDVRNYASAKQNPFSVHGFSNYMLAPDVAVRLAEAMGDMVMMPDDRRIRDWSDYFLSLPQLKCYGLLKEMKDQLPPAAHPSDVRGNGERSATVTQSLRVARWFATAITRCV